MKLDSSTQFDHYSEHFYLFEPQRVVSWVYRCQREKAVVYMHCFQSGIEAVYLYNTILSAVTGRLSFYNDRVAVEVFWRH